MWLVFSLLASPDLLADDWSFPVKFDQAVRAEKFSGRVYLFFSKGEREPRFGPNWFHPEPFAARDVSNLKPDQTLMLSSSDPDLLFYPEDPAAFDPAGYQVQAVMRFDDWSRNVGTGEGNGYSQVLDVPTEEISSQPDVLVVNQIVPERKFVESDRVKLCEVESRQLSDFYGRQVKIRSAVILPEQYESESERRYPTLFVIPGFGGTHFAASNYRNAYSALDARLPIIKVILDPSCPYGHHVFADSQVNGPWGSALIEEYLPEFEKRFRAIAHREARYLTGHSSGGWSSLWLMVSYPSAFGATWSTAPDPVTFRDFQQVNMYRRCENIYFDQHDRARPLARRDGEVVLLYPNFDHMETVLGRGGQLRSFEAVFGPRQLDGAPVPAWDRKTGRIDGQTIRVWEQYDILKKLKRNWCRTESLLRGRIHVHMGDQDTFYLEGATELLQQKMKALGEPEAVTMHPERTHFDLLQPELRDRINREIEAHYRQYFQPDGTAKAHADSSTRGPKLMP
ncbi:MAG: hypothetical protein HUJ26_20670 [Planctomycetaceae bacterium]|nr:hypothetical protein [Planctomycetaceae bacterium]